MSDCCHGQPKLMLACAICLPLSVSAPIQKRMDGCRRRPFGLDFAWCQRLRIHSTCRLPGRLFARYCGPGAERQTMVFRWVCRRRSLFIRPNRNRQLLFGLSQNCHRPIGDLLVQRTTLERHVTSTLPALVGLRPVLRWHQPDPECTVRYAGGRLAVGLFSSRVKRASQSCPTSLGLLRSSSSGGSIAGARRLPLWRERCFRGPLPEHAGGHQHPINQRTTAVAVFQTGISASTRRGEPEPPLIFSGAPSTTAPVGGSWSRLVRHCRPNLLAPCISVWQG